MDRRSQLGAVLTLILLACGSHAGASALLTGDSAIAPAITSSWVVIRDPENPYWQGATSVAPAPGGGGSLGLR